MLRPSLALLMIVAASPVVVSAQVTVPCDRQEVMDQEAAPEISSWREAFRGADTVGGSALMDERLSTTEDSTTLHAAFQAAATVMSARHLRNPFARFRTFRRGTSRLDAQVRRAPLDPDIRVLRLMIQVNAPAFLGYRSDIQEDCAVVTEALRQQCWQADPAHEAFVRTMHTEQGVCS